MSTRFAGPSPARQRQLRDLFEAVCGTTVIREQQEEQRLDSADERVESPVTIESYLEESLRSDGLEDAIGRPDQ